MTRPLLSVFIAWLFLLLSAGAQSPQAKKAAKGVGYARVSNGTHYVRIAKLERAGELLGQKPTSADDAIYVLGFQSDDPDLAADKLKSENCGRLETASGESHKSSGTFFTMGPQGKTKGASCLFVVPKTLLNFTWQLEGYPGLKVAFPKAIRPKLTGR